jgi:hypothetical protein
MLPPHTLSPHAPSQVAVLSRASAESHAERRIMLEEREESSAGLGARYG